MGLGFRGGLCALVLFCAVPSSLSWSDDLQDQKKLKEIHQLLIELRDDDARKRSDAAHNLGNFPYEEVKLALRKAIDAEMSSGRPNSYVIGNSLEAMRSMISSEDSLYFAQLGGTISRSGVSWARPILKKIDELVSQCEQAPKTKKLAKLPVEAKESKSFLDRLKDAMAQGDLDPDTYKVLAAATETDISHEMERLSADPRNPKIVGRDTEADKVLKIMVRVKSRIPVLTGEAGVGKTAVAQAIALNIQTRSLADWFMYDEEFPKGTVVLQTSGARIGRLALSNADSSQAAAIELYLDAVKEAQKVLKAPVILFLDEIHTLTRGQKDALKPYAEQVDGVRIIGATTNREFQLMIGTDNAMKRRLTPVPIHELSEEETVTVLRQGWIKQIEARYRVTIPDEVLPVLVKIAGDVTPDLARPDSPIKFIQDLAIECSHGNKDKEPVVITEERARDYATSITGLPINPRNPKALLEYIEKGRAEIKERVVGQDHLVDGMVNTWLEVLTADAKKAWRSVVTIGTTGTGKSLTAQEIGRVFLKEREKVLRIDCTAYSSGPHALNSLLGAPNGIISSDETKGVLPEYLAGRGRDSGVIIFDEFDKAHPDLAKKLMEMLDRGILTGGDGREYRLGRHLIVFTTNRGANKIFNEHLGHLLSSEELTQRVSKISESQARSFFTQSDTYAYLDEHKLPPEVVGRVDHWMIAKPITFEDALKIASLKAQRVINENLELHKLHMAIDPELLEAITRVAFVPADGARPVEKRVEKILSLCRASAWAKLDQVDGAKVAVMYEKNEKTGEAKIQLVNQADNSLLAELPFEEPTRFMALKDPRFLETLMNLEKNMLQDIYGQDPVVKQLAAAVRARANRPLDPTPLSVWLLGSTGVGKTESAKVLAKYLYGSKERAQVISFGKVNHMFELNDIFGSPRGIVGSESKAIFETILESFPEGTVIVFDELSNMGRGAPANEKEAMFKRMYEIFGEGKWTNAHGKVYDLANFTFVLTGNDGEQLFEGLPNEDLRIATWEKNNTREKVRNLLRQSNIPEAFINRIDNISLMRPLADNIRAKVVNKFLANLVKQMEQAHGVKLTFAPDFEDQMGKYFFPIADGARGTERFVKIDVAAFVGDFVIQNYPAIQEAKGCEIVVRLDVKMPDRHWAAEKKEKPRARLVLDASLTDAQGQKRTVQDKREVEPTSAPRVVSVRSANQTAAHEAGHALINEHLAQPMGPLRFVTIESAGDFGGYASYRDDQFDGTPDLAWVIRSIAVLAAGSEAQKAFGAIGRDAGWRSDRERINTLAYKAVVDFGLIRGLEYLPPVKKGQSVLSQLDGATKEKVHRAASRIVREGILLAAKILEDRGVQQQMTDTVKQLIEKGSLKGDEFEALVGPYRIPEGQIDAWTREGIERVFRRKSEEPSCGEAVADQDT